MQQSMKEQETLCTDFRQKIAEKTAEKEKAFEKRAMLEKQYLDNLSAILASELREGQPCPVCGSIHHEKTVSQTEQGSLTQFAEKRQLTEQHFQKLSAELSRLETAIGKQPEHETERLGKFTELKCRFPERKSAGTGNKAWRLKEQKERPLSRHLPNPRNSALFWKQRF